MGYKTLVEVSFQVKRKNNTVIRKKEQITIPGQLRFKVTGGDKNLNLLTPYLIQFIDPGETIKWYTIKTLISNVELHNKKKKVETKKQNSSNNRIINSQSKRSNYSLIFLPFTIAWRILKWISKD